MIGLRPISRWVSLAAVALVSSACVTKIAPPKTAVPVGADPVGAWAALLEKHVTETGKIDFVAIKTDPADLNLYVAWAATNGPQSTPAAFPTRESKLVYYLNTYNAVCMYNAIHNRKRQPENTFGFFLRTKLRIDGRDMSLYALENEIIRPMGDPRVHFILNCMVRGCPRLPREPMKVESLEAQLEAGAKLFFSEEPRNVDIETGEKVVRLSSILKFYTGDFIDAIKKEGLDKTETDAANLIAYANNYRESKIPEDFKVEFIPYDWTLNQK